MRTESIDNGQRALGVIAVIEDVSERRRLEDVRRDFVANVSHELKTPMGALGLLAETLLSENEPQVAHRLAQRIHTEAFRISRVIDDLLDLSRIENEESPPREPVPINLVMAEAAERVKEASSQRQIEVKLEEPNPQVVVLGDRRQLTSAVYSLLENAVKFSPQASRVRCIGRAEGDEAVIVVEDQGVGIPSRDLERIFERFYRVDAGRSRSTGGTGLGLAIVRHVAANHRGSVQVESREGEGSTFTLRLPRQQGPTCDQPPATRCRHALGRAKSHRREMGPASSVQGGTAAGADSHRLLGRHGCRGRPRRSSRPGARRRGRGVVRGRADGEPREGGLLGHRRPRRGRGARAVRSRPARPRAPRRDAPQALRHRRLPGDPGRVLRCRSSW